MPELPEVETMRRGIASAAGAVISKIVRPPSPLQPIAIDPPLGKLRRRAVGRRIERVGRLGKRVLLELDSGDRIVIEPRMTGLVFSGRPARPQTPAADHRTLRPGRPGRADPVLGPTRTGRGTTGLPQQFDAIYGQAKIGPDALEISAAELRERLRHSAGNQGCPARSKGLGRRGKSVCLGNPASRRHSSGTSVSPLAERPVAARPRRNARRAARRDPAPRLDIARRHLSHRPRRTGQLSVQPSRLSATRAGMHGLWEGPDRADRTGPAFDILLSGLPAKVGWDWPVQESRDGAERRMLRVSLLFRRRTGTDGRLRPFWL